MIFVRHPRVDAGGICYGRHDPPLGSSAVAEIAALAGRLGRRETVWSSPAARCRALAEAVAEGAPRIDPRLTELDFGAWEGAAWAAIPREDLDEWAGDPWHRSPPGGETFAAMHARVGTVLREIPRDAVVVTHAGVIRAAEMILTGATFDAVFARPVPYAEAISWTETT